MKKLLVMLMLIQSTPYAYGELYRWTDSQRVSHYTNSLDDVPVRYRARVKVLYSGIDQKKDSAVPPQVGASVNVQQPTESPSPVTVKPDQPLNKKEIRKMERLQRKSRRSHDDDE